MTTPAAPSIFIRNAYLEYDGIPLFNHLNMTITAGKCTCLLGPSGVGKTTLLRIIAGLICTNTDKTEVFHGEIKTDSTQPLEQQIAYLAQNDLLFPWLNALDNTLVGARLRGELSSISMTRAEQLFAQMGLGTVKNKFPHQLSGGMRQRVALIRTLLEDKPIVLMDEPFSALDAITRFQLQTLAAELLRQRTVLLVTHDPLEALRLGNEIYVLSGQPAQIQLAAQLSTTTPRDPADTLVTQHQAPLFHMLAQAKENMQ